MESLLIQICRALTEWRRRYRSPDCRISSAAHFLGRGSSGWSCSGVSSRQSHFSCKSEWQILKDPGKGRYKSDLTLFNLPPECWQSPDRALFSVSWSDLNHRTWVRPILFPGTTEHLREHGSILGVKVHQVFFCMRYSWKIWYLLSYLPTHHYRDVDHQPDVVQYFYLSGIIII